MENEKKDIRKKRIKYYLVGFVLLLIIAGVFYFKIEQLAEQKLNPEYLDERIFKVSFNPLDLREIGYEFLDSEGNVVGASEGTSIHVWNIHDDYFFNKSSGIQLTNHFQDYWSKNVFCIGYYSGEEWVKIKCADELPDFNKNIQTDNLTYVNATLWKDFSYGSYDLRLGVRYHLGLNDENLSITVYAKNIGIDIPYDLGFAWKVQDLNIPPEAVDRIFVNNTNYGVDGTYDLTFKNMTVKHLSNTNWNETCLEICGTEESCGYCIINQSYSYEKIPFYNIYDNGDFLSGDNNFLRIDWDETLPYALKMYGDGSQESFTISLLINAGQFDSQQEKSTTFYWIDALTDNLISYWKLDDASGDAIDSHGSNNGTATGVTYGETGKIGDAFGFTDDKVVAILGSAENDDWSVLVWAKMDTENSLNYMMSWNDGSLSNGIQLHTDDNVKFYDGTTVLNTAQTVEVGVWYFVVLTKTGTTYTLYSAREDGSIVNASATRNDIDIDDVVLGNRGDALWGFYGDIDEVALWDRELSSVEVTELFNSGDGLAYPFEPPPYYVYSLNITNPLNGTPLVVNSSDNISVNFNFFRNSTNLTTGVTMESVFIGGINAPIITGGAGEGVEVLDFSSFESDMDGWTDGGADAGREETNPSCGSWRAFVKDDTSTSYIQKSFDFTDKPYVIINFSFFSQTNIDENECVYLKCDGDTIDSWGTDSDTSHCANNMAENAWYNVSHNITTGECTFDGAVVMRFESEANGNTEVFGLDCINLTSQIGDAPTQEFAFIDGSWNVNVTVPAFESGLKDLFVNATYDGNTRNDTETNAINYGVTDTSQIDSCSILNESIEYTLTDNIIDSSENICMNITANNVTLDCQGYTIDGKRSYPTYGIYTNRTSSTVSNITIKNCNLSRWYAGIYFEGGGNNTIFDNVGTNNSVGIFLNLNSNNSVVYNNVFDDNQYDGFIIYDSSYNVFYNNTVNNGSANSYGFIIESQYSVAEKNILYNNTANGSQAGFYLKEVFTKYNRLYNNTAKNNDNGFFLDDSKHNMLYNNTAKNNDVGITFETDVNSTIYFNVIENNIIYGLYSDWQGYDGADIIYNNIFNNSVNFIVADKEGSAENYWNITNQSGVNIFNSSMPYIGGNYWTNSTGNGFSDTCTDANGNGYCDDYYNVTTNSTCSGATCGINVDFLALSNKFGVSADTCTYTSGTWNVDCSDDCIISSPVDLGGDDIFIIGTGTFTMTADIFNFGDILIQGTSSSDRCEVFCSGGCFNN